MDEQTAEQLQSVIDDLRLQETNASLVCLVDKDGQLIAASGDVEDAARSGADGLHAPGTQDHYLVHGGA
jgi:hypothetical protein